MNVRNIPLLVTGIVCLLFFESCKRDHIITDSKKTSRMVLVYMEANNDLKSEALHSINGMERLLNITGAMLVYIKTENEKSCLLKIKYDTDSNKIVSDTVKIFVSKYPSDLDLMREVIHYSQAKFPSDSYGLIFWSHATFWFPPRSFSPKTESFGLDRGQEMDIIAMKNALPDNFDFIVFDACSMAGLEVLFEFKNKTRYIIASPTETIAESYPYQLITRHLFKETDQLKDVAEDYFEYFNVYTDQRRPATVSLFKTAELPQLAKEMKALIQKHKKFGDILLSSGVQRMDFDPNFPVSTYDFAGFLAENFPANDIKSLLHQLNKAILYKASTPSFLSSPIHTFSGIGCYIPAMDDLNLPYYKHLKWYQDSGLYMLFEK